MLFIFDPLTQPFQPPLQAIWSINESYSRTSLLIVTVAVAVATYATTFNLNNLVGGLRKVFAPKRRALIEQMRKETDSRWQALGERFKTFQKSERGQVKPSEWIIWMFLVRSAVVAVVGSVRKLLFWGGGGERGRGRAQRTRS